MRKRIFEIIEVGDRNDRISKIYDVFMMISIFVSMASLVTHTESPIFDGLDGVTATIFIIDYILRWITADYKLQKNGISFVLYPVTIWAIIDLVSILPSIVLINKGLRLLRIFRLLRILRIFKVIRYSKSIRMLLNVFKSQKESLIIVGILAMGYILITAMIMFNVEPDTFENYFEAIYWATVSLTTVGYGDIFATSVPGQIITIISSIFGIAIVALPAGIITAGYMKEVDDSASKKGASE